MSKTENDNVFCPLLNREIEWGYCWELCNIGTDDILLEGDVVKDWNDAQKTCQKCGRYEEED